MARLIGYRLQRLVAVLLFVTVAIFAVMVLAPGDPVILILGQNTTPQAAAELRAKLGLDRPLPVQYLHFMAGLVHGDLGRSYQTDRPVIDELAQAVPVTLELAVAALLLAAVLGIGLGMAAARRPGGWVDQVLRVVLLTLASLPVFWIGLVLIWLFAVKLPWLPPGGWGSWSQLVLPALSLAAFPLALIARLTRTSMLEAMRQDYIKTARAKGIREGRIVFKHAFRNVMVPVVTVTALQFGTLLAGAVITETVFSLPGLGQLLLRAVLSRDYALIRGCVLLTAMTFAVINLAVDLSYGWIDPRIRFS